MFALHETTQRRVCRIAFVALCIVPTALTLAAVAYCNRPWRHSDWQDALASRLHLRAEIAAVSRPLPGTMLLTDVRLAGLESERFFCSTERLHFQHVEGRLVLDIGHLEIPAAQLSDFWSAAATWLATGEQGEVELRVDQLTIAHETFPDWQLSNVAVRSERQEDGTQQIVAIGESSTDAKLRIELTRTDGPLAAAIDARQTPLPAWLVGTLVPGVSRCSVAEFKGMIAGEQQRRSFSGRLQGNFAAIDLQHWVGPNCPHLLQGSAAVDFETLTWSNGRLTAGRGSISSGNGAMSYSLFDNAQKLCGCVPGPTWKLPIPSPPDTAISFDQLNLRFQLSTDGITLAGIDGALMTKNQAPLVKLPSAEITLPVSQLVRLLNSFEQPGWLPATRHAHDMADSLPLPGDDTNE